jgi:hypothetical protein
MFRVFGDETFGRADAGQFVSEPLKGRRHGIEAPCRELGPGQARRAGAIFLVRRQRNRRKIVILARIEQGIVRQRPRRDNARQFALDESLGELGILDLFANGGPVTRRNQLREVAFELVIGKAGHGNRIFTLIPAGERQPQHASRCLRIVVEQLIKISHAKQEQRIAAGRFGIEILLHHGGHGHEANLADDQVSGEWVSSE